MIRLYDYALSGNCFKVRLLLDWLGLAYEKEPIDFYPRFQHRSDTFLAINPLGQIPVIFDDGEVIRDAQAILVHLAAKYDQGGHWYPLQEPSRLGQIQSWLAFADAITGTISAARLHDAMFFDLDADRARTGGHRLMRVLDEHLWFAEQDEQRWLCPGERPTVADIACFPYVALSEEGGVSQAEYPSVVRWIERFMRIDGFKAMAGMVPKQLMGEAS